MQINSSSPGHYSYDLEEVDEHGNLSGFVIFDGEDGDHEEKPRRRLRKIESAAQATAPRQEKRRKTAKMLEEAVEELDSISHELCADERIASANESLDV
jgi:hypothetical protein